MLSGGELARWWRKRSREGEEGVGRGVVPAGSHPLTAMSAIAGTPEGAAFMAQRREELLSALRRQPRDGRSHALLASYLERAGDFAGALASWRAAVGSTVVDGQAAAAPPAEEEGEGDADDREEEEGEWRVGVARCLDVVEARAALDAALRAPPIAAPLAPLAVERRAAAGLSYVEFIARYAAPGVPVIITGLSFAQPAWTLEHVRRVAGACTAVLRRHVPGSPAWARLEDGPRMRLDAFIDALLEPAAAASSLYLHDWSLPLHCPALLSDDFTVPRYFCGDLLRRLPRDAGLLYTGTWPSLFVGPAGTRSDLHVDAFGSHFWMALLQVRR